MDTKRNRLGRFLCRPFYFIIVIFAVFCLILALCGDWNSADLLTIFIAPCEKIGLWIRESVLNGKTFAGWCLYLFLGLLPIVFPVIRIVKTKKFYFCSLLWFVLSGFVFVMLYFYVNPHLLDTTVFTEITEEGTVYLRRGTMLGMQAIFFLILTVCVLCEFGSYLEVRPEKAYLLAKLIFYVLALGAVFAACFLNVTAAKINWKALDLSPELSDVVRLNIGLNKFAVIFSAIAGLLPAAVTVILLIGCAGMVERLKVDAFDPSNIKPLNGIIKLCKLSVLVTLGTMAVNNIVQLCLSKWLLNASYTVEIPLVTLLAICLVLIFAQILKRAILINEENRLTI